MNISISKKIMLTVLLPILILCLGVSIMCSSIFRTIITDEIQTQLSIAAYNFKMEYGLIDNDELDKAMIAFKEHNDIDVTIFNNDKRELSTVPNAVGTSMEPTILKSIRTGQEYFATDANVNGQQYFGYYIPIMNQENNYIGAAFTGIPTEDAEDIILSNILKVVGFILLCSIVTVIITILVIRKIISSLKRLEGTVGSLLNNDLTAVHEKYPVAKDEVQEICNNTADYIIM